MEKFEIVKAARAVVQLNRQELQFFSDSHAKAFLVFERLLELECAEEELKLFTGYLLSCDWGGRCDRLCQQQLPERADVWNQQIDPACLQQDISILSKQA